MLIDYFKISIIPCAVSLIAFTGFVLPANADLSIKIDLRDRFLYLIDRNEDSVIIKGKYPIAIGDPKSPTPTGSFKIMRKENEPVYKNKAGKNYPPGPDSPVGSRLMTFHIVEKGEYSIHGTPWPVWVKTRAAVTGGCIRMLNKDIIYVFDNVKIGTIVNVTDSSK